MSKLLFKNRALAFIVMAVVASSCTTVKEYQKSRLNDSEMIISHRKIEKKRAYSRQYYQMRKLKRGGQSEKIESTSEIPNV